VGAMEVEPAGPARLAIRGEVDLSNADELEEILLAHVGEAAPDLTLDLAALSFMDSTGIMTLLRAAKALGEREGRLVLESPQPMVRRVLEVLRLGDRPEIEISR
jgi:anti-anti-sigma factor